MGIYLCFLSREDTHTHAHNEHTHTHTQVLEPDIDCYMVYCAALSWLANPPSAPMKVMSLFLSICTALSHCLYILTTLSLHSHLSLSLSLSPVSGPLFLTPSFS